MRSPRCTSEGRRLYVVETASRLPGLSTFEIMNFCPARSVTRSPPSSRPVRIFGPLQIRQNRERFLVWRTEVARTSSTVAACWSCVPWEKFSRTDVHPRVHQAVDKCEASGWPAPACRRSWRGERLPIPNYFVATNS